jgi:hypothetical protein
MHPRKVTVTAAAAFAICAAFAAQPTSLRADWGGALVQQQMPWSPGSVSPMSSHDPNESLLIPPR